jgi:hypothetical protein
VALTRIGRRLAPGSGGRCPVKPSSFYLNILVARGRGAVQGPR